MNLLKHKAVQLGIVLAMVAGSTTGCGILGGGDMEITAEFSDSAGLFVGNDVGILGVQVGRVTKIEPKGEGVTVTMVVSDDGISVPANANAVIVSRSVATDRYVELTPTYSSGDKMADGAHIPLERTETPVDFDQVLSAINEFSVGIAGSKDSTQAIKRFLEVSARTFGPHGDDMNHAITNLGEAVNSVSGQRDNIVATFSSLDTLAATLVENRQVVQRFVDSLAATTQLLAAERTNFRDALVKLSRTVEVVAKFAQDNRDKLKGTVADVADVADILLSRRPQVEEFIETMPLVLQNLQRARAPGGIMIRAPLQDILTGTLLNTICLALPKELCQVIDGSPVGDLLDLIDDLLIGLGDGLGG